MKQVFAILAVVFGIGGAQAATLTVACGSLGIGYELCKDSAELWAKRTGNVVLTFPTPLDLEERRSLYGTIMEDEVSKVDVFEMDLYDVPRLRSHLLDLSPYVGFAPSEHFPDVIDYVTYEDGLKAMPLYLDFGILYYRSDLLEKYDRPVPRSWIELRD